MAMIEDDEIVRVFIEESTEHLDGIESDFLEIEKDGADINVDLINKVFRAIHSVKGGAGFLGLDTIKELAHEMENLLNMMRNGELTPTPEVISILLTANDKLNDLITHFAESNEMDISEELVLLKGALSASVDDEVQETLEEEEIIALPDGYEVFRINKFELDQAQKAGRILYLAEFDMLRDIERKDKTALDIIREIQQAGQLVDSKVDLMAVGKLDDQNNNMRIPFYVLFATVLEQDLVGKLINLDDKYIYYFNKERQIFPLEAVQETGEALAGQLEESAPVEASAPPPPVEPIQEEIVHEDPSVEPEPVPVSPSPQQVATKPAQPQPAPHKAVPNPPEATKKSNKKKDNTTAFVNETLRVNLKDLDTLMTLAGELVLTRNQLLQTRQQKDPKGLENAIQRVDLITSELQEAIMATRMQPIGIVFNKFQRVVRDLSKKLNKKTELIIEGEGVEMDKTIIEAIGDPLTHLVRNAVDHGIEDAETRAARGKSPTAVLRLSALHEAGQVVIKVEDDGGGIDPEKIKAKALEKGFVTTAELEEMSDNEVLKLIFRPGFSMAKQVTDISGRGVGMDVVFSNLSKLGGTIDIHSTVGVGTTLSIKLPLTLAIIPSLIVKVGEDRFALPQVNLVELVRIPANQVAQRIEKIDNAVVMRLRGALLPIIDLSSVLQSGTYGSTNLSFKDEATNVVVVNAGSFNYGIIVDDLLDSEEIVVKPLGRHLNHLETYAGATILGDGRAALILDIIGISKAMKLKPVKQNDRVEEKQLENLLGQKDSQSMLLLSNGHDEQFAIPLGLISRIEKIQSGQLSETSGRRVLKYRGGTLIVLAVEDVAQVKPRVETAHPYVVVFKFGGREVGIVVAHIVDVVDSLTDIDEETFRQPGIVGSSVIMGRITLMLDLYGLAAAAMPEKMVEAEEMERQASRDKQNTILIIEDSKFFLNQIKGFTEDAGYNVVTALDGVEGLEKLQSMEREIDLILTDIEMPNLDGIGFTREVRAKSEFQDLPILALTSVAGEEAEKVALEAGIDEYLIKLDREKVLANIETYLKNGRQN
ncbi:MAG: response regulator [Calditrichaeota bacterium]|nr:MAG: response regulator [Calditrichota bacterium]